MAHHAKPPLPRICSHFRGKAAAFSLTLACRCIRGSASQVAQSSNKKICDRRNPLRKRTRA